MAETIQINVDEAWECGLSRWKKPSVPYVISPRNREEREQLGEIGRALSGELAFMKFPEFQTYQNLERIIGEFSEDPQRGLRAVSTHELGHRFCPYDIVSSILLRHSALKGLKGKTKIDEKKAADTVLNLFSDMCINTKQVRQGDEDLPWVYYQLSRNKGNSAFWRVYAKSMELAWKRDLLPEKTVMSPQEQEAAEKLFRLFERNYFDRSKWKGNIREYAGIIAEFLETSKGGKGDGNGETGSGTGFDDISENLPDTLDEKTAQELAKRLAEIGSNGLPTNPAGMEEFKEIMAGFGQGDATRASIAFYNMLSDSYDVMFATQPFGRPRVNPFQPVKWTPGMGADKLDVDYSVQVGGRVIPGVNTYAWNSRRREVQGGLEEVVPNLDIYLDSSGSMPNPINQISLPVLAGFVAAKKAVRKGAKVRSTNFSGNRQSVTTEFTTDLPTIFGNLVTHYNGGTVFPTNQLTQGEDPKQVIVITDTFVANEDETGNAIRDLRKRNKDNRVTIYALSPTIKKDYLTRAGAEVIHGTSTDIFKRVIGKATEVYTR